MTEHWQLDPTITFLNHGSFGACPRAVLDYQNTLRTQLEAEPVHFMTRELPLALNRARDALGGFLGASPDNLVFVPNATTGFNAVLRSLEFKPGDEIVITDHTYPACRNAADFVAQRSGARVVLARIPFPIADADEVRRAVLAVVTPQTRLVVTDHVTSPSALVLPVEKLCKELAECKIDVLIDGAHAPGMLTLDIESLGATFYAGNCHKWMCAPKGAGFLWVTPSRHETIFAPNISIGLTERFADQSQFHAVFDWTGTADPTAYLSVPEAIRFFADVLDGGWATLRAHNHGLTVAARDLLCRALGIDPPCADEMLGSMAAFPIVTAGDLAARLFFDHNIEVPVKPWSDNTSLLRISCQLYNRLEEYERLANALAREGVRGATLRTSKA